MNLSEFFTIRPPTKRQLAVGAVLFLFYFTATIIAARAIIAPTIVSAAAGIGLAGLVLEGTFLWPAIYLAALAAYLFNHPHDAQLYVALILPIAETAQAVIGASFLKRVGFDPMLRKLRDVLALFAVAVGISLITPTFGLLAYAINHYFFGTAFPAVTWSSWWGGTVLSTLIVAPFAIRWLEQPYFKRTSAQIKELAASFSVLIIISTLLFWTPITEIGNVSLVYFLLIPLFWIALRAGSRFMTLAIAIVAASGIASIFWSVMAPPAVVMGTQLFEMEIFMIIIAGIFLILVGIEEERKDTVRTMTKQVAKLEDDFGNLSFQDRAKSEFVAVLAHELRNPLAPMVSSLELLRLKGLVYTEGMPILDQLDDRIKTIRRLLDDILDLSRISQNKLRLQKEYTTLQSIVTRSVQSVEKIMEDREQSLSLNISREPLRLNIDAVRIEQVITNLLNNASKFTESKGHIWLSARQQGGVAEVRVRDNGSGIDPEMLQEIFEPFRQVEGRSMNQGLGIGLSLARQLVEMHEGTIEARSKGKGHGSEFILRLPFLAQPTTQEAVPRTNALPLSKVSGTHHVLVVDDNVAAAQGIGKLLEYMGYLVEYAYTGEEAVKKAMRHERQSIILDIGLPDMDGYMTARALRGEKIGFEGVLIALTGYGQDEDKQKAYAAGFDHHLTKPVGVADLQLVLIETKASL